MASAEFDDKSAEKRPAVQVGDPFMEKLLLEACLEVMATDACVGVQDMGAAGLTCSTSETGSRGGVGVEIDVAHVPQRETGMTPYEIMLSESQERMLLIVKRGREAEVERIFEKWDLHAVRIGEVTPDERLRVQAERRGRGRRAEPRADRRSAGVSRGRCGSPRAATSCRQIPRGALKPLPRRRRRVLRAARVADVASKRWIYRQYDHMVRTNTIVLAGLGAGVVRVKGTTRALAMSVDGNGRFCYLDPRQGARLARGRGRAQRRVRRRRCRSARTNCLNFGNPERPEIMWQFAEAVAGTRRGVPRARHSDHRRQRQPVQRDRRQRRSCRRRSSASSGVIEDATRGADARRFRRPVSTIVLLGENLGELGGSEYLKTDPRAAARRAAGARSRRAKRRCSACSSTWRADGSDSSRRTTAPRAASR